MEPDLPWLRKLEGQIRYTFLERSLLRDALTHPTFGEGAGTVPRNDDGQFAFLGDALISLALADREIDGAKGVMPMRRAEKASNDYLETIARKLDLPLFVGRGEAKNALGESKRLATGVEAVLGAVYQDAGAAHAIKVAKRLLNEGPAPLDA